MSRKKKTKGRRRKSTPVLEDEPMPVMEGDEAFSTLSGATQDNLVIVYVKRALNHSQLTGDWFEECIMKGEDLEVTDALRDSCLYFEDSRGEINAIPKSIPWRELCCKLKDFPMRVEPKSIPWRELCCKLKDFPMRVELVFFEEAAPWPNRYCRTFFLCVGCLTTIVLSILPSFPQFRHLAVPFDSLVFLTMQMTFDLLGTPFAPNASPFYFLRKYHPQNFKQFVTKH